MSKITIHKTTDDITIVIKDDPGARKRRKSGILLPAQYDVLPRRGGIDAPQLYMRIFDLAQLADGSDIDFIHNAAATLVVLISNAYFRTNDYNYAANWKTWLSAISLETWTEHFKEVTDLYNYGVTANLTHTGAADGGADGWTIEPETVLKFAGGNAFRSWDLSDTTHFKITGELDFDADEIEFTIDDNIIVFLAPVISRWNGRGDVWQMPRSFTYPRIDYWLNGFYKHLPRNWFLDNAEFEAQFGVKAYRTNKNQALNALTTYPIAFRDAWFQLNCDFDGTENLKKITYGGSFDFRNYQSHVDLDGDQFLRQESTDVYVNPAAAIPTFKPYASIVDGTLPGETLVGAILKGEQWFFVWNRADNALATQSNYVIAT